MLSSIKASEPASVKFSNELVSHEQLVLGVYSDEQGPLFKSIDGQSQGSLSHAIKASEFSGELNTTKLIVGSANSSYQQVLLVGLGSKSDSHTQLTWQEVGGKTVQAAIKTFKKVPEIVFDVSSGEAAAVAYGAVLGNYYFDKYYTSEDRKKAVPALTIVTVDAKNANADYQQNWSSVARAIVYTRDISNEPANIIYPESFVSRWKQHFKGMENIEIEVIDENDMLDKGMGAIYGVGRGSKRPPRMMIVEYMGGNKDDAPIVLVGKGITFDTGGISIKGSKNMWNMKFDMSGAASAIGTVYALAGRKAKVNVVGIAAMAENMPGANAQRPGDVVKSMSGKTIQIRSTDAEGRLVLADGIYYGDSTYNPKLLVDLATLTGSASRALGADYAAMFTRDDTLVNDFTVAGKTSGDEVWQLPLNKNHFKAIENNVADVMNSGPDAPGASAGAAFLGTFVRETTPWVHFDIAGVAYSDKALAIKASPGSRSFGVRLLNEYIKANYESK